MNNLIIGIAGGSGSGKTTLACRLKALFGEDEVRLISHDSYYKRHDELPFEERCKLNYDHPDAFDNALLIYHLQELKAGRAIDCPVYDYSNHNRSDNVQHIEPAPVLIVEGILPFVEPELCAMFDYKIFVDTDADERILRRLVRDVKERGRSLDSVIEQYLTTVKPMHEAFVEPSKRNADIIVPNGGENTTAIEMLAQARTLEFDAQRLECLADEFTENDRAAYGYAIGLVDACRMARDKTMQAPAAASRHELVMQLAGTVEAGLADIQELLAERFPGETIPGG